MPATAGPAPASSVQRILLSLHAAVGAEPLAGEVAAYIPELARADPALFGVATASADGDVNEAGDTRVPFTIQSISKPLLYGMALERHGVDAVLRRVGVEPTGDAFNAIRLAEDTGTPLNPMVNAGAIATTGLVLDGDDPDAALGRVLEAVGRYAGRELSVDEAVYRSERATGHRNRAIAHLLRNFDVLGGDPETALDLYFRQCSILLTCRDLATIGATLANRGVNPVTGVRALEERHVAPVLSVMATCGMYDAAGQWLFDVGLPAKSGVAGGVLAVLPGQIGIAAFSPPLDAFGNSVRGVRVCDELSRRFSLHLFEAPRPEAAAIRRRWSVAGAGSRRRRPEAHAAALRAHGERIQVHELHGDIGFTAAGALARACGATAPPRGFSVFDISRVTGVNRAAAAILADLGRSLGAAGTRVVVVDPDGRLEAARGAAGGVAEIATDLDAAVERCEDALLAELGIDPGEDVEVPLERSELCRDMPTAEVAELAAALERVEVPAGGALMREGDAADELFVIVRGRVRLLRAAADGGPPVRLAAIGPGMLAGETAFIDGLPRSASALAESPVVALRLTRQAFAAIRDADGRATRSGVLLGIARCIADRMRRVTAELAAMS